MPSPEVRSAVERVARDSHSRLIAFLAALTGTEGRGQRFDPGHGRLMKEWFALEPGADESCLPLAREAMDFAVSKR